MNAALPLHQWIAAIDRACRLNQTDIVAKLAECPPRRAAPPDMTEYIKNALTSENERIVQSLIQFPYREKDILSHTVHLARDTDKTDNLSESALIIFDLHWNATPVEIQQRVILQAMLTDDKRFYARMAAKQRLQIVNKTNFCDILRTVGFSQSPMSSPNDHNLVLPSGEWQELITCVGEPFVALDLLSSSPDHKKEFAALLFGMPCDSDELAMREESFWEHLAGAAERGDEDLINWLLHLAPDIAEQVSEERLCAVVCAACRFQECCNGTTEERPHVVVAKLLATLRPTHAMGLVTMLTEALQQPSDAALRSLIDFYVYWAEFYQSALKALEVSASGANVACVRCLWNCLSSIAENDTSLHNLLLSSPTLSCIPDLKRNVSQRDLAIAISSGNFVVVCENLAILGKDGQLVPCYLSSLLAASAYHAEMLSKVVVSDGGDNEAAVIEALTTLPPSLLEQLLSFHAPLWITERGAALLFALALSSSCAAAMTRALLLRFDPRCLTSRPLREACVSGRTDVVNVLLADKRVDVTAKNNAALRMAADRDDIATVKLLLAAGADPGDCADYAARWAAIEGRVEMLEVLLADPRTDPSCEDGYGRIRSCKQRIMLSSGPSVIRKLLKDISRPFPEEARPLLLYVAKKGFSEVTSLLLRDGRCYSSLSPMRLPELLCAVYDNCDLSCLVALLERRLPDFALLQCLNRRPDCIRRQLVAQYCVFPDATRMGDMKEEAQEQPEKELQEEMKEQPEKEVKEEAQEEVKEEEREKEQEKEQEQLDMTTSISAERTEHSLSEEKKVTVDILSLIAEELSNLVSPVKSPARRKKQGKQAAKEKVKGYNGDNMDEFLTLSRSLPHTDREDLLMAMTVAQLRILCRLQRIKPSLSKKEKLVEILLKSLIASS